MEDIIQSLETFGLNELWILKIIGVFIAVIVINFIVAYMFGLLIKASEKTKSEWDDTLFVASSKPLPFVVWVVGISIALKIIGEHTGNELFDIVPMLRDALITVCFVWFFWRLINEASDRYLVQQRHRGDSIDYTTVDALTKLGHLVVIVGAVLTLMQTFGFSVSGLLAAGGIGGIAIGFAAKDILANFFGGLTIYSDRPFEVGDWVRSPDKDIEGVVEKISWRYTQIKRFNENPIYVPNALFTTIVVENPSRMSNRRIKETIGIRYDDIHVMAAIVEDVKAMLKAHVDIDTAKTLIVNFNAFNASSIDFFIYTFSRTVIWEEFHDVKQDVLLKTADIIAQHGAEMAFPTQTLHIANSADDSGIPS
ncbi:MAG: MscS family membrane protein [Methylophilaceae bacterium]